MTTLLALDSGVYPLETVQKAAYRFIDRLTILISRDGDKLICQIDPVRPTASLEPLLQDFKRELLDQQLRQHIKTETESVRNLILAYAFSRSGLQG